MRPEVAATVEQGDLDELIRLVDRLCSARDWDGLAELRARCHAAHQQSGRQLWPAAAHAEYRLALEAPASWAARVLVEGAGRFAAGPLSEVAASTHEWAELAPHLEPGPPAVITGHERVLRGEDLTGVALPGPPVLDLPQRLEEWEPAYCLAEYRAHEADFPAPPRPDVEPVTLPPPPARASETDGDPDGVDALRGVVAHWVTGSGGRADAAAVDGDAAAAIAALGATQARVGRFAGADALAVLAWAGAAGGAHGRRRGAAAGRLAAWWAAAGLSGLLDEWPPDPDTIGDAATRLRWYAWDAGEPGIGWVLRVAVEDPDTGRAWALDAVDPA
ncbi:MAG TPA: DUF6183 family protein [Acidimicrobiia bacterium]|nr:DUF6183 family protein [Acidimicrobiia bacterium]